MRLLLLIGIIYLNQISCQSIETIVLTRGQPIEFTTPGYPNDLGWAGASVEWKFVVYEADATVKVVCDDIKMVQRGPFTEECEFVSLSAIDGKGQRKVCNRSIYNFVHKSDGSTLTIRMVSTTDGTGKIKCTAINTAEPDPTEVIQLHPHVRARKIKIDGNEEDPMPYLDRLYSFESPAGTRMSFQCKLSLSPIKPMCGKVVFTFNDGQHIEEVCESNDFVGYTKDNKGKIRLQLDHFGHGGFECDVQAITGSDKNEYNNVVNEEEDSSEYGVTPGKRGTSCKCGWTNKSGARIIHGEEAERNEFPWMVHMYITHNDNGYPKLVSCGGSVITPRHILSAAHCVVNNGKVADPEYIWLIMGKHNTKNPTEIEQSIDAERIFVRDIYLKQGIYYEDIALIFIRQTLDFRTPFIGPVCVERDELPVINKRLKIMGWGHTENYEVSDYLRKATVRVIDPIFCDAQPWDVCTTTMPSATCSGDSGGPLVWLNPETNRYTQISLVSRGSNRCRGPHSTSTLVAYFYDWIQQIISATDPSVRTCHQV